MAYVRDGDADDVHGDGDGDDADGQEQSQNVLLFAPFSDGHVLVHRPFYHTLTDVESAGYLGLSRPNLRDYRAGIRWLVGCITGKRDICGVCAFW